MDGLKKKMISMVINRVLNGFAVLAFTVMAPFHLQAQQEIDPVYLTIVDGLASNNVRGVYQDSYGLIWIGTNNGLQKYDGYGFETFQHDPEDQGTIISNDVWGMTEDADHNMWVGSAKGVSRFDRRTKTFTNYNLDSLLNFGSGSLTFTVCLDSQKRIWARTLIHGLMRYDPGKDQWIRTLVKADSDEKASIISGVNLGFTEDSHGDLWTSSRKQGLLKLTTTDSIFRPVNILNESDLIEENMSKNITELYADPADIIWITSRDGIYKFDPASAVVKTIKYYTYKHDDTWNQWNTISQDHEGNIWIANNFRGLLKFEGITDNFQEVLIKGRFWLPSKGYSITLTHFFVDKSGIFWFGNRSNGLIKYDPAKNPFELYTHDENDGSSLANNSVFGLTASEGKPGILYVGTQGSGMDIFDPDKKTFQHVLYDVRNDMYGGAVRSIGEKDDGTLLLGTWGDGLIELDKNHREVKRYTYQPNSDHAISDNRVRVIKKDMHGNFWIGTNSGLNFFNVRTGEMKKISTRSLRTYSPLLLERVKDLAKSDNQVAEIAHVTDSKNLSREFAIADKGTYLIEAVGESGNYGLMADFAWLENSKGDTIWNGNDRPSMFHAGGGSKNRMIITPLNLEPGDYSLHYFSDDSHSYGKWNTDPPDRTDLYGVVLVRLPDRETEQFIERLIKEDAEQPYLSGSSIQAIVVRDEYLWVGTNFGLNKMDLNTYQITTYMHDPENVNSLGDNLIKDVCEDMNGILWITTEKGLTRFDPVSGQFIRYTEQNGLPTNLTESILPGNEGEMWISTQNGLSQMVVNRTTGKVTFINYNADDGLGGNTFIAQVAARTPDGKFWFGGEHGLNSVGKIQANDLPPQLLFTDLKISNQSVYSPELQFLLTVGLNDLKEIKLNYNQNNLNIEFAAIHYANPDKNQYSHMLKGYENEWIYDNRNHASYTNLAPGEYEFMIRGSNAYGVWNDNGRSIRIIIAPPWWQTRWAYGGYILLFILIVFGIDRFMRKRVVQKERERAKEKELAQAREIEKAYRELKATQNQLIQSEKMASLGELTAGIAHEIQNPLNFVNNFSEVNNELIEEAGSELNKGHIEETRALLKDIKENEMKINHHGRRADAIVKGMLQHSRSSNGQKVPTDINALADEYLRLAYHGLRAKDKSFNADFKLQPDEHMPKLKVVPQDIGRVLLNLINNAFYAVDRRAKSESGDYKPKVDVITKKINLPTGGSGVEVLVKDNGPGIPGNIKDKIFQPFFTTKPTGEGTGLGLSMSYDIITKGHGGTLEVRTEPGEGTTFFIELPIKQE